MKSNQSNQCSTGCGGFRLSELMALHNTMPTWRFDFPSTIRDPSPPPPSRQNNIVNTSTCTWTIKYRITNTPGHLIKGRQRRTDERDGNCLGIDDDIDRNVIRGAVAGVVDDEPGQGFVEGIFGLVCHQQSLHIRVRVDAEIARESCTADGARKVTYTNNRRTSRVTRKRVYTIFIE